MLERTLTLTMRCPVCLKTTVRAERTLPEDPKADISPTEDLCRAEIAAKTADWGAILTDASETIDICPLCWSTGLEPEGLSDPSETIAPQLPGPRGAPESRAALEALQDLALAHAGAKGPPWR